MTNNRNTLVLYTTAVCNLNCRYCYIDKNPALAEIDCLLDESFQGDYYTEFTKEMFPDPQQLTRLETWGGEPFLRMDRLYATLDGLIRHYPNLRELYSSTNAAFDEWIDQFFGLMRRLGQYPDRRFFYTLQLSLDGPETLNDRNRGAGVTKRFLANYEKMADMLGSHLPENVNLHITFKPTLTPEALKGLGTKNEIITYYRLFDELADRVISLNYSNVTVAPALPNMACPCLATRETGRLFAEIVKLCREVEGNNPLKYHSEITPFSGGRKGSLPLTARYANYTCGTGYSVLGLLPNRLISACHNGFVDLVSEYKRLCTANNGESVIDPRLFLDIQPTRLTMTTEQYQEYERQMGCFNCPNTGARLATIAAEIAALAHANQIDSRYKDQNEALKAGIFYQSHTAYCVRDNLAATGSLTMIHHGLLRLLLNGAHPYLEQEGDITWIS